MPRHPKCSPTSAELSSSIFSALRARARSVPGTVHALHVGDTWREPPASARCETLTTAANPLVHAYPPVHGEPELLDVLQPRLSARAGRDVAREAIQVVAGATGGLSVACQAMLDPGDEVIVPTPCWPLITGIVASRGAVPVQAPVMTRLAEPGFDLEAALERLVTPRTAAIYLNTPHNPTGSILTDEHVGAVARVAQRRSLWVLCDEVYDELRLDGRPAAPAAWARPDLRQRAIAVHSISKSHGMAGCRIGWLHGPQEAVTAIRAVFTQQAYAAARPMQRLAARALVTGDAWLAESRALYAQAASRAAGVLGVPVPQAGTFLFTDARRFFRDGEDCAGFLTRCLEAGVLLTPGVACGRDFESSVRLCFTSVGPLALDDALSRLRSVIRPG